MSGRGERDGGDVVAERPPQVGLDGPQCAPGKPDGVGGDSQVAAHQGEVARFDGDVCAGAHRDAKVGLGEGGGVVDAVTDHRNDLSFGLQPFNDADLVGREHFGDDGLDADLVGDGAGGASIRARRVP